MGMVKLSIASSRSRYLGIDKDDRDAVWGTHTGHGVYTGAGDPIFLNGANAGMSVEGEVIQPKQKVFIPPTVMFKPSTYQMFMTINPRLFQLGTAQYPGIIEPQDDPELTGIVYTAIKPTNLTDLSWVFRVYLMD